MGGRVLRPSRTGRRRAREGGGVRADRGRRHGGCAEDEFASGVARGGGRRRVGDAKAEPVVSRRVTRATERQRGRRRDVESEGPDRERPRDAETSRRRQTGVVERETESNIKSV